MTGNEVPKGLVCIRCSRCDGLYTTDMPPVYGFSKEYYEPCPICQYDKNRNYHVIPIPKFKILRWWRRSIFANGAMKKNKES